VKTDTDGHSLFPRYHVAASVNEGLSIVGSNFRSVDETVNLATTNQSPQNLGCLLVVTCSGYYRHVSRFVRLFVGVSVNSIPIA